MEPAWIREVQQLARRNLSVVGALASPPTQYTAASAGCALLDRSERGKLALSGTQAKEFLQGQVTNDVEALTAGTGCYAAFLTPKGKMLGDLRILDAGGELLLDTERVSLQELFNLIRRFSIGFDVALHKRTREQGLLSLIGPQSDSLLISAASGEAPALEGEEHRHVAMEVAGAPTRAMRTNVGIDLLCEAGQTQALADALGAQGAVAIGEETAEIVRVEHGRPRYGVELDESVIPQEAGLNDRAVSFTKGCYVGQETVARLFYRGKPNRQLRGLRCERAVAAGEEIVLEDPAGRIVGQVASVAVSPRLGPLALAFVRREAPLGATVRVGLGPVPARVVELPFA